MYFLQKIPRFFSELKNTAAANPVEILLCISIFATFRYDLVWTDRFRPEYILAWLPVLFTVSYCLNNLFRHGAGRAVYYLSALLVIPAWQAAASGFTESVPFVVLFFSAMLLLPVHRFYKDNVLFAKSALFTLLNIGYAFILSLTLFLLAESIYGTINVIFLAGDFFGGSSRTTQLIAEIVFMLIFPAVFLVFDRMGRPGSASEIPAFICILIKYVFTPAIIIYTLILYAYFATIAVKWELPDGGLSVMVFVYIIVSLTVQAVNRALMRPAFAVFYKYFGYIALLPVLMMWTAALYRVDEYGFTQARIYLVLSDAILTGALLCLMSRRLAHYLYIVLGAIFLFSFFTYIPPVSAERLGLKAQVNRIYRYGNELGLLGAGKKLIVTEIPSSDTLRRDEYEKIVGALKYYESYVRRKDKSPDDFSASEDKFGISSRELKEKIAAANLLREKEDSYSRYIHRDRIIPIDVSGFSNLYPLGYYGDHQTVTLEISGEPADSSLPNASAANGSGVRTGKSVAFMCKKDGRELLKLTYNEIMEKQLRKTGIPRDALYRTLNNDEMRMAEFCRLDTLGYAVMMSYITLTPDGKQLEDIDFDMFLTQEPL